MRLSAKPIKNYDSINSWQHTDNWTVRALDSNTLYFQLVDLDRDGLRYIPTGSPATVSVVFPSIDDTLVLNITATQVSALDGSIFSLVLGAAEIPGSGAIQFKLVEGVISKFWSVQNMISVEYQNNGND